MNHFIKHDLLRWLNADMCKLFSKNRIFLKKISFKNPKKSFLNQKFTNLCPCYRIISEDITRHCLPYSTLYTVIDLFVNSEPGRQHHTLAIPTLVRKLPVPVMKIIGDLSNTERVFVGLDLAEIRRSKNIIY